MRVFNTRFLCQELHTFNRNPSALDSSLLPGRIRLLRRALNRRFAGTGMCSGVRDQPTPDEFGDLAGSRF